MAKLTQAEIDDALRELPGWSIRNGMLVKTYEHGTFPEAIVFVNAVAHLAELANHHPDIDIRYTTITMTLSTHSAGGLTGLDFELAAKIDAAAR